MSDLGKTFSEICLSWLCCAQPLLALFLGILIGRYGGIISALGYAKRALTAPRG